MHILLLGSGGREHALAWKLKQSSSCTRLYIAPGNAGTAQCGENVNMGVNEFDKIRDFVLAHDIQMVVVGPEEPLVKGIYDFFKADSELQQVMVIGPSKAAAQLEGSKAFAKAFMQRHHIPTAAYREFDASNFDEGVAYLQTHALPVVLKADGLAAGKGVLICQDRKEAIAEFENMIRQSKFGDAGKKVVVEAFLTGIEMSVFVLTDGNDYVLLPSAKDYKRIGEGDTGLNTGGMGAISPVPFADDVFMQQVEEKIIGPTIAGLRAEQLEYKGFVFFGLIKVGDAPYVIEYNCRMGDPETEVVMPRLQTDLVTLFEQTACGELHAASIAQDPRFAVTIMAVSGGYPGDYKKGYPIHGLDQDLNAQIFHAGTTQQGDHVVTNGGRVLAVTSFGKTPAEAAGASLQALDKIQFQDIYFRRDIGYEFLG